jgi:hypothetical protein
MMTNRGIFETFPGNSESPAFSPFSAAPEPASSPFTAVHDAPSVPQPQSSSQAKPSPFTVIDEAEERPTEPFRPAKIPEKRKPDSPFQIAEPTEGFGSMPTMQGIPANPFEAAYPAPSSPFAPASPFTPAGQAAEYGAFAATQPAQAYAQPFAPQPFTSQAYAAPSGFAQPVYDQPASYVPSYPPAESAPAPAPAQSYALTSDSSSIRQLELRAIFGVDREMGVDEIIQRCRALPGIRNVACLGGQEAGTIESLKALLAKLGYGGGALRIYAGQVPVEFIREGNVLLAVQTDGGFAPGVRETLMIVAREMARIH